MIVSQDSITRLRAALIKLARTQRGYSIENISSGTGIAKSTISKLENNRRNITMTNLEKILSYCNISFRIVDRSDIRDSIKLIQKYISGLYYLDKELKEESKMQFLKLNFDSSRVFDDRYFYLIAMKALLESEHLESNSIEQAQADSSLQILLNYEDNLPDYLIFVLDYLLFLKYQAKSEFKKAFHYLQKLNGLSVSIADDNFKALIKYQYLKISIILNSLSIPIEIFPEVKNTLLNDRNYHRLFNLHNMEAIFYMNQGDYLYANNLYIKLQNSLKSINSSYLKKVILENRIWCEMNLHNYETALSLMNTAELLYGLKPGSNLFFRPYCYYKTGEIEAASEDLKKMKSSELSSSDKLTSEILGLLYSVINKNRKTLYRQCIRLANSQKYKSKCLALFFYKTGMQEAELVQDYETAFYFSRSIIELSQTRYV